MVDISDTNGAGTFGDGSNNWFGDIDDFVSDPDQAVRGPYDMVTDAAGIAALNFGEGVGGFVLLFDDETGSTVGPDGTLWIEDPQDRRVSSLTRETGLAAKVRIVVVAVVGLVLLYLLRPPPEIIAGVVGDE